MEIIDEPRYPAFDPKPFITYDSEQDVTPTAAELVEELPEYELPPAMKAIAEGKPLEKPLRRGIGYLRAELAPEDEDVSPAADIESDFGAGLDTDTIKTVEAPSRSQRPSNRSPGVVQRPSVEPTATPETRNSNSSGDDESSVGRKRRRRPRRRRGKADSYESATAPDQNSPTRIEDNSPEPGSDSVTIRPAGTTSLKEDSSAEKPKRNRRRRRRKRGSDEGSGDKSAPSVE